MSNSDSENTNVIVPLHQTHTYNDHGSSIWNASSYSFSCSCILFILLIVLLTRQFSSK